eukprot:TRINITY_DN39182_c0_g1_i1.p1 TRINITY_DN39182_c0_g1~~TRINITY_DN39182_c0_g1_i1.p1  ORF type:complete len:479 (-),score=90.50 TRINITY_DN39182_c0_g1_i1:32-1468(-)
MAETAECRWEVQLRQKWVPVGPEDAAFIASAWAANEDSVSYRARGQQFTVDFVRRVQRDASGRERPLRLVQEGQRGEEELSEAIRRSVREETAKQVLQRLSLSCGEVASAALQLQRAAPDAELSRALRSVTLFTDPRIQQRREDERALLHRCDVLASPCAMEFGEDWCLSNDQTVRFWVHHIAAINIGESKKAPDYRAYCDYQGGLDEGAYLIDMRRTFNNLFHAQALLSIEHSVIVPIGMGAFLRNLAKNDPRYSLAECDTKLRTSIATELAQAAKPFVAGGGAGHNVTMHLCLGCAGEGTESESNRTALVEAFRCAGFDDNQAQIHFGQDATALAEELARQWWKSNSGVASEDAVAPVSLVNAANAWQLGNHWFNNGALRAIDENLHRRSSLLAAISLMLNRSAEPRVRFPRELAARVEELGGCIVPLHEATDAGARRGGDDPRSKQDGDEVKVGMEPLDTAENASGIRSSCCLNC